MNLFRRVKNLWSKPAPPKPEKSILTLGPGDICEVSLVTYQVTGRIQNRRRNAVLLTLQDGNTIRYLYIEQREKLIFSLYSPIDGRLDSTDEVPTVIEMDGRVYHLEEQYAGTVQAIGSTPFMQGGEQHVWQFQSDDSRLLRIEWQDGRFMLYEGEWVLPADVQVVRGAS